MKSPCCNADMVPLDGCYLDECPDCGRWYYCDEGIEEVI